MIKKNIFLISILISNPAFSESEAELYQKVFGKKTGEKIVSIPLVFEERFIGEAQGHIQGSKLKDLNRDSLISAIRNIVRPETINLIKNKNDEITLADLPFEAKFNKDELIIELFIPDEFILPQELSVLDDFIPYYSNKAVDPATFAFLLNYKYEYNRQHTSLGKDSSEGVIDKSIFWNKLTFENDIIYNSLRDTKFFRESSVLTYDFDNKLNRLQAGDVANNAIGYQQSKNLGGISFYRDFSINPYKVSYPTSKFTFDLDRRSLVKTFVNNLLIKSEYLNAGKHTVKDIPLNNGVNKIIVEIEDEFGQKRVLNFSEASSGDLLSRGQSKYDISIGKVSYDTLEQKKYDLNSNVFISSYYQFGLRKNLTIAGYLQNFDKFNLLGSQTILASRRGNLIFDLAGSKNEDYSGTAKKLTYQLNLFGPYWYDSHTLTFRMEHRDRKFNESESKFLNNFDFLSAVNYSVPVLDAFTASLGASHSNAVASTMMDKITGDFSVSARLTNDSSLNLSYSRSRNFDSSYQTQAYVFFNINFQDNSTYVSSFYDKESNQKKLTAIYDNGRKLNELKLIANIEDNYNSELATIDTTYNTQVLDFGFKADRQKFGRQNLAYRYSPRMLGSLAFVFNQGEWGATVSRPINGSFAVFKPHQNFSDQKFGIRSHNNFGNESSTGLFGEALVTNLTPYQLRQVQLDPTFLEPGFSLGQESYVLRPRYKSGHLFVVGKNGQVALKSKILNAKNEPVSFVSGYFVEVNNEENAIAFFTNKKGMILIEGLSPAKYKIVIDGFESKEVDLSKLQGLINLDDIKVLTPKDSL